MEFRQQILILAVATALQSSVAARAEIIVTDWSLTTAAADNRGDQSSYDTIMHDMVTFPFIDTHTAVSGPTSAESRYDFTIEGNSAALDFGFSLARSASESWTQSHGLIRFLVTEPTAYAFRGQLAMSGTGLLVLRAGLVEAEYPNPHLYIGDHASWATPDESFALGTPGGDLGWTETGDITGTLTPNVAYILFYYYGLENNPVTQTTATAEGSLNFALIPEPSSVLLLALGGLVLVKRRHS